MYYFFIFIALTISAKLELQHIATGLLVQAI